MAKWIPTFKVNGIVVPVPDNYSQTVIDLSTEESGRKENLAGLAVKDVIGIKTSVPLKWEKMEWNVGSQLALAVDGKESLEVQMMDIRHPYVMTTMTIYVGDRNFEPVQFDDDGKVYWSVEFSEIQR